MSQRLIPTGERFDNFTSSAVYICVAQSAAHTSAEQLLKDSHFSGTSRRSRGIQTVVFSKAARRFSPLNHRATNNLARDIRASHQQHDILHRVSRRILKECGG